MDTLAPSVQDSVPLVPPTSSTSSTSRPDAHTQKYDRQLRLWASSGQTALENSNLLIINSNSTATSSLKNLVLPGIGKFSLLDPELVKQEDLGTNFFLDETSLGKPRAEQSCKFLMELNRDVIGTAIVSTLSDFLNSSEDVLKSFNLILAIDVSPPKELTRLSELAWSQGLPLIKVESFGFYGSITSQLEELTLVETHPESLIDLRLNHPFKELIEFSTNEKEFNYDELDSAKLAHVPAVVILIKALHEWGINHGGKQQPEGTKERKEFLDDYVLKGKRKGTDQENFDEAVGLYRRSGSGTNRSTIPQNVQDLFKDDSCRNLTIQSSNFWILVNTLERFTKHEENPNQLLPLTGSLPDMKSHSTTYVKLQQIYREKAKKDLNEFEKLLKETLSKLGQERVIEKEEIESFVKHSAWIKVLRGRKLNETLDTKTSLLKGKIDELLQESNWSNPPDQSLSIYLALLSSSRFFTLNDRYPGSLSVEQGDQDGTKDLQEMYRISKELLKELDYKQGEESEELPETISKSLQEVCRSSHSTLPQTSALLGGLVAQEAIKLITKQYVPLNPGETCIWDGITSMTGRVKA